MKAELKPRINLEGRTPLQDVIPLSTPYLVFLDPSSLCNSHCKFCPTGTGENKKHYTPGLMDLSLYRKIIDDLCRMPEPIKTLRLYADGEPLINPQFSEMVRYAKTTGRFGRVDTTSNGILLAHGISLNLISAGLDKIFVSVPRHYRRKYVENIRYLYERGRKVTQVYVKIIGDGLWPSEISEFMEDFGDISDRIFIENLAPCWPGYHVKGVKNRGIYNQPLPKSDPKVCPYIFYSLKINSDGTVSLCFVDFKHEMFLGDLRKQSFSEVWNSKLLRDYRIMHLSGGRPLLKGCGECKQLLYGAADVIDDYAQDIFRRITT
jgi:radical SAM protein with 4Fe4S-binding SPASM domain